MDMKRGVNFHLLEKIAVKKSMQRRRESEKLILNPSPPDETIFDASGDASRSREKLSMVKKTLLAVSEKNFEIVNK